MVVESQVERSWRICEVDVERRCAKDMDAPRRCMRAGREQAGQREWSIVRRGAWCRPAPGGEGLVVGVAPAFLRGVLNAAGGGGRRGGQWV